MTWLVATLAAFATYYAARAISSEDGPFGVFDKLRMHWDSGYLGKGVRCVVCVSAYTALPVTVALCVAGGWDIWLWPIWWLGLAGASVTIDKWWKR